MVIRNITKDSSVTSFLKSMGEMKEWKLLGRPDIVTV